MKLTFLLFVAPLLFTAAFAQTTHFEKECRLAGGGGFANGFGNSSGGPDIWLQMSYRLSKNFSVGTEFENMYYKRPSYFQPTSKPGAVRKLYDNYISFIIKYHLPIPSKLQFNAACGWSYRIIQENHYYYETPVNNYLTLYQSSYNNFAIPFIAEIYYPLGKIFQAGIRGKYNLNANNYNNTYSAALALSLKL